MVVSDTGSGVAFLARLGPEEISALRLRAVPRRFERGATLMHHDEVPGRVLVIERGHAKVTLIAEDGKEIVLPFRGPGDLLGDLSVLGGEPRSEPVRELEPLEAMPRPVSGFDDLLQ